MAAHVTWLLIAACMDAMCVHAIDVTLVPPATQLLACILQAEWHRQQRCNHQAVH